AVDKELDARIAASSSNGEKTILEGLKGKAAVANAKLAYESFKNLFHSDRFEKLKAQGARPQRPLWASTGTKNPAYSDVLYVTTLIGPHTVNTMPRNTIQAFLDHGDVRRTVDEDVESARAVMQGIAEAGIDFDAITDRLENEGIDLFITSYNNLIAGVEGKRAALADELATR
ncbi:MAG: transaldolase family protein, partial [Thermomicrobiales bacterium]